MWDFEQFQGGIVYIYVAIVDLIQSCIRYILFWFGKREIVKFDNDICVRIGKQIAEGGFSVVFEASDYKPFKFSMRSTSYESLVSRRRNKKRYALKRIICCDPETLKKCEGEAKIHRMFKHANLLPLIGMKIHKRSDNLKVCLMLFPHLSSSLRDEINARGLIQDSNSRRIVAPFKEREILEIFSGCVDAVTAMHERGLAHRDIKVENVMFDSSGTPILIDYGSVGPLNVKVQTRSDVLQLVDESSSNSTISYRAPELFDGGTQYGKDEPDIDGRIDVWSLGCVLFAIMYGTSPFECEFRNLGNFIKIVECSHLRIIGKVPRPEPQSILGKRYDFTLLDFVEYMLTQDRFTRPSIQQVSTKLDELLQRFGGTWRWRNTHSNTALVELV